MARFVKIVVFLVLLGLDFPAVVLTVLLWPAPDPPSAPDWRGTYDDLISSGDARTAYFLLGAALTTRNFEALSFCAAQPDLRACRDFGGTAEEISRAHAAARAREARRSGGSFVHDAILRLSDLEVRFHERRAAGLRFALMDGWLSARCGFPLTRVSVSPELLEKTLAQAQGRTADEAGNARARTKCDRREQEFGDALKRGAYGDAARAYAGEWARD